MTSDVVLSAALRSNLLSLQNTQKGIDSSQFKLSTGKKVNSALDNPQSFFAAQALTNRATDLTKLLDGIGQSIQVIKAADNGVTALTSLINQADSIATSAQDAIAGATASTAKITGTVDLSGLSTLIGQGGIVNTDGFTVSTLDANGTVATTHAIVINTGDTGAQLASKITAAFAADTQKVVASLDSTGKLNIESTTSGYNLRIDAVKIAGSTTGVPGMQAGIAALGLSPYFGVEDNNGGATQTVAATIMAGTSISSKALQSSGATATLNTQIANITGITGVDAHTDLLTITAGGQTLNFDTFGATVGDLVNGINNGVMKGLINASFDGTSGKITLTATSSTVSKITFGNTAGAAVLNFGFGTNKAGAGTTDSVSESVYLTNTASGASLTGFQTQYNNVLAQINSLVTNGDTGYRGTNLLNGNNLVTTFNESRTSTLTTAGVKFDSTGLGLATASFTNQAGITTALTQTRAALTTVRAFGSSLAGDLSTIQTRQDFTNNLINTLKTGSDLLVNADQNEEGAKLLALQTRQSLGVTALSLASQSQQSILRLFS